MLEVQVSVQDDRKASSVEKKGPEIVRALQFGGAEATPRGLIRLQ